MAFKLRSSGLPFKEIGSSPAKQTLKPTDMSTLRSKQRRSSKGVSEHQHFSDPKSQGDEPRVEYGMTKKLSDLTPAEIKEMKLDEPLGKKSPAKQTKEVKGTSVFGKSPKDFAKNLLINQVAPGAKQLYKKAKKAYNTYKGKKAVKESGVSKAASEAVTEGGKMALKQSMKKIERPGKATMTKKMRSVDLAKAPTLGPKKLPVNEGEPKRAVNRRS